MKEITLSQTEPALNKWAPVDSRTPPVINLELNVSDSTASGWQVLTAVGKGQETKIKMWFGASKSKKESGARGKVGD